MSNWLKTSPLRKAPGAAHDETWSHDGRSYPLRVRLGKPMDILALKANMTGDFGAQLATIRASREALYAAKEVEDVKACPLCGSPSSASEFALEIYGARYHRCSACTHHYVIRRPTQAALERFYAKDAHYAATYADKKTLATRVEQVASPKARWVVEEFERLHGRKPRTVLDVGAGSGHFVHACRLLGLKAEGLELSESGRGFCRDNFGFELLAEDFTKNPAKHAGVDVVTFWGVIEHVPQPMAMLKAARLALAGPETLLVAAVPRWDAMSTAVQTAFPEAVARHLDPLGHVNCFTDESLATAYEACGFAPAAAWYFGMDAYELVMQFSHLLKDGGALAALGPYIPALQGALDRGRLTDEIALAGRPV
jgi:2-polyprenyl-3-methyl-5-hydroxy-6-metoxy-1,4-benzoquinol methylase